MRKYIHVIGFAVLLAMGAVAWSCQDQTLDQYEEVCNPSHPNWPSCKPVEPTKPIGE